MVGLLHAQYTSGNILTAGSPGAAGTSGLNVMAQRVNFGGFDFPETGSVEFTYANGRITKITNSGLNYQYDVDIVYDGGFVGSVVTSGTSIGSQITDVFYNNGAQFVSGITKIE